VTVGTTLTVTDQITNADFWETRTDLD